MTSYGVNYVSELHLTV